MLTVFLVKNNKFVALKTQDNYLKHTKQNL